MFILIAYDVDTVSENGAKRLRKVAKECLNYGQRVQNSVFECVLTEAQYVMLKAKIVSIIKFDLDNVRIYHLGKSRIGKVESIGKETSYDVTAELII